MNRRLSLIRCVLTVGVATLTGCNSLGNILNPFYDSPSDLAKSGERNDHAISGGGGGNKQEVAREALERMASYQRAHDPQPQNPVMNPSVVRLMWVPDHLNKHGDLVPAHYFYLKVRDDYWALNDSFEIESQLHSKGSGGSATSNIPFVHAGDQ